MNQDLVVQSAQHTTGPCLYQQRSSLLLTPSICGLDRGKARAKSPLLTENELGGAKNHLAGNETLSGNY
jgi:hypothetical protein